VQEEFDRIVLDIELAISVTYFVDSVVESVSICVVFVAFVQSSESDSVICDVDMSELIVKNSFLIKTKDLDSRLMRNFLFKSYVK
jgi:hypothetical protein